MIVEEKVKMNVTTFKPAFNAVDALLEFFCDMHELYVQNPEMQVKNLQEFIRMTSDLKEDLNAQNPQHTPIILLLESLQIMSGSKYSGLCTFRRQLLSGFSNSFYSTVNQQVRENRKNKQY